MSKSKTTTNSEVTSPDNMIRTVLDPEMLEYSKTQSGTWASGTFKTGDPLENKENTTKGLSEKKIAVWGLMYSFVKEIDNATLTAANATPNGVVILLQYAGQEALFLDALNKGEKMKELVIQYTKHHTAGKPENAGVLTLKDVLVSKVLHCHNTPVGIATVIHVYPGSINLVTADKKSTTIVKVTN